MSTPYGIRDIKITAFTDKAGTTLATTSVDLPYARQLSFSEVEDYTELRGDDKVVASVGSGPSVEFDLEAGGIDFAAFKAMAGGTVTTTGTGATMKTVYAKKGVDARPYFKIEGQAISDSGGDVHTIIWKAKCTGDLSGEFKDGEFFLTKASGIGIPDATDRLYDFVENGAIVPITP